MGKHLRKGAETCRARSTAEGPSQQGSTTLMVQNDFTDSTEAWNVEILTTAACWKRQRRHPSPSREARATGPGFSRLPTQSPRHLLPLTWAPRSLTSSTDHRPSYWIHTNIPPSASHVASFWYGSFHLTSTTWETTRKTFTEGKEPVGKEAVHEVIRPRTKEKVQSKKGLKEMGGRGKRLGVQITERTMLSQGLAHVSRLPDKQRATEQTIINSSMKMATAMKTESKPEPAGTRPASCSARITPLMVPCGGKTIFSKSIVYLNRGLFI